MGHASSAGVVCPGMRYAQGGGLTPAEQRSREQVRMEAAARFERGESISRVARVERVSVRQVEKWRRAWRTGGTEALRSAGPQSPPRLSSEQFSQVEAQLRRGPAAHGWDVDQRWTLSRIVTLVERLFGIWYTPAGMSLLLRRNGWSVQVPVRRAVERDEAAVQTWKNDVWPQVKPPRRPQAPGSSSKTSPGRA